MLGAYLFCPQKFRADALMNSLPSNMHFQFMEIQLLTFQVFVSKVVLMSDDSCSALFHWKVFFSTTAMCFSYHRKKNCNKDRKRATLQEGCAVGFFRLTLLKRFCTGMWSLLFIKVFLSVPLDTGIAMEQALFAPSRGTSPRCATIQEGGF